MHNRNEQVAMFHFPPIFIEYSKIHMTAVEGSENLYWNWFDEVSKYTVEPNAYGYILNDVGISRFNKLKTEKEFSITQKNLEMQKLRGDVDKLSNELTDYDNVKSRLKRTEVVAWVSIGLLLLKLILEYSGCKSG